MKVAVIGLDGMSWALLAKFFEHGAMPFLNNLLQNAITGVLESTIPPMTAPAWTSVATGVNPGKHGIFDFVVLKHNRIASSLDVRYPRIHEMVALKGKKSICINQPFTYPITKLEGVTVISDWLSPKLAYYPKDLEKHYSLRCFAPKRSFPSSLSAMQRNLQVKKNAVITLMNRIDWNLFWIICGETDFIFHKYWIEAMSGKRRIVDILNLIDAIINEAREIADAVFIVSDHGFKRYESTVNINSFLRRAGLVRESSRRKVTELHDFLPGDTQGIRKVKLPSRFHRWIQDKPLLKSTVKRIYKFFLRRDLTAECPYPDPELSDAYMPSHSSFGVFLNNKDLTKRILDEMRDLEYLDTVWKRDEVYQGPHVDLAPHIIFKPKFDAGYIPAGTRMTPSIISRGAVFDHHPAGIVAIYAKHLTPKNLGIKKTFDIAPTILRMLGLPRPIDSDGHPIPEIASHYNTKSHKSFDYSQKWALFQKIHLLKKTP